MRDGGALFVAAGQHHLDAARVRDHVRIGHDVAAAVDDDAGSHAALAADHQISVVAISLRHRPVARDEHLHDALRHVLHQRRDRTVQDAQRIAIGRFIGTGGRGDHRRCRDHQQGSSKSERSGRHISLDSQIRRAGPRFHRLSASPRLDARLVTGL
jgi:hypothetical protein